MARDPIQEKADKLDKETQETQAKQKAEFEKPRKNMPGEPDQGPLPDIKKGLLKGLEVVGGKSLGMKKGGKVSSASKRADGCCIKGKTKGRMV